MTLYSRQIGARIWQQLRLFQTVLIFLAETY